MAHIDLIIVPDLRNFFDDRENILAPVIAGDLHCGTAFPDSLFCALYRICFRAFDIELDEADIVRSNGINGYYVYIDSFLKLDIACRKSPCAPSSGGRYLLFAGMASGSLPKFMEICLAGGSMV